MNITAIVPWFGSKRTLAERIIVELGDHSAYWDPFCGSLAVLLQKPESSHETVNDMHGDLINLARVIADPDMAPQLHDRLIRVLVDERRRGDSLTALQEIGLDRPVERAFHWFIAQWFGRNGFSGTVGSEASSFAVRWTPTGGHGGQRFASAVDSLPAWHARLRRVTILNRNAFEVIAKIEDHPKVAIYCDPPYITKGAAYVHDFVPLGDADCDRHGLPRGSDHHDLLAKLLGRFKQARVVVSYYAHPRIATLYAGWTVIDHAITKGLHNAGKRGQQSTAAPEILIVNGPSFAEPAPSTDTPSLF